MRLGPFLVVLWIMYLCMGLLNHTIMANGNTIQYGSNAPIGGGSTTTTEFIWSVVVQPENWTTAGIIELLVGIFAVSAGIATVGAILTRSDIYTLAPVAAVWLFLGGVPMVQLYNFVTRNTGMFISDCVPGSACVPALVIASATVGVIALLYVFTVIEWWFWRPATQ